MRPTWLRSQHHLPTTLPRFLAGAPASKRSFLTNGLGAVQERGVEFPTREGDEGAPYLTPPAAFTPAAPVHAPEAHADAGEPAAYAPRADPLADVDEQDRAAIQVRGVGLWTGASSRGPRV
jgi:hypothetical protein